MASQKSSSSRKSSLKKSLLKPGSTSISYKKTKKLNLFNERQKFIEEQRETNPIGLERMSGKKCDQNYLGRTPEQYACLTHVGLGTYGDSYWYDGTLSFSLEIDPEKHKVKKEYIVKMFNHTEEMKPFFEELSDHLGILPEFRECRWGSGINGFGNTCDSAEHIRQSLTPGNLKNKFKEEDKPIPDEKELKKMWQKVQEKSLYRGFFFKGMSIGEFGNVHITGAIISPIHEFLPNEMERIKKLISEAIYVSAPPEYRMGKRKRQLEFFS